LNDLFAGRRPQKLAAHIRATVKALNAVFAEQTTHARSRRTKRRRTRA